MAVPLLVMAAMSLWLAGESRLHRLLAALQIGGYAAAAIGLLAPTSRIGRSRPVALARLLRDGQPRLAPRRDQRPAGETDRALGALPPRLVPA